MSEAKLTILAKPSSGLHPDMEAMLDRSKTDYMKFALETYGMLPHERMDAELWRITADRQRTDSRMLTSVPPVS